MADPEDDRTRELLERWNTGDESALEDLVGLHGGDFQIQSDVGVGTAVRVHFPPARVMPVDGNRSATV